MENGMFTVIVIIVTIALVRQTDGFNSRPCGPGWLPDRTGCYKFVTNKLVTKTNAREECHNYGATLLRIATQDKMDWVAGTVSQISSSGYWTDLYKTDKGTWSWDRNEPANMTLIKWNTSPANDGQSNCAGFNIQGKLTDLDCKTYQGYMCSIKSDYCPSGWIMGSNYRCFFFSNTSDPTQLVTFEEARQLCASKPLGSILLDFEDEQTQVQIDDLFHGGISPALPQTYRAYWVDLTYHKGGWSNLQGAPLRQTNGLWAGPEPDNVAGMEDCAVVRMSGRFSDRNCQTTANFVCEAPQYTYTQDLGCGKWWLRADPYCYRFYTESPQLNWADARSYCQQQGGDLVKLDTFNAKAWLYEQLKNPVNNRPFWTGLNDRREEGALIWGDGSPIDTKIGLWNEQPNNFKGDEHCAVIYESGHHDAVSCSTLAAVICEMDVSEKGCPSSWRNNAGKCYLFTNESMMYTTMFTNSEAINFCGHFMGGLAGKRAPAKLLSISTIDEMLFVKEWFSFLLDENVNGWYTSLNDKDVTGYWSYGDGTTDTQLINWTGEPRSRPDDNCGLMNGSGAFHMRNCVKKLHYICQKPLLRENGTGQNGSGQNGNGQNGSEQNGSGQNGSEQNGSGQNESEHNGSE